MTYCEISKEMSSLYFGLDVCCQFEARVPESDQCSVYSVHKLYWRVEGLRIKFPNRQNTVSPKYNDDISLLIVLYLVSDYSHEEAGEEVD